MALADIPQDKRSGRLDSWKEIAEYLRRDVRTATRWESQGLPLHRVAGAKGRSVFAFTHEIDAWLAGNPIEKEPPEPQAPLPSSREFRVVAITAASALVVLAIGVAGWPKRTPASQDFRDWQVTATATQVVIDDASGASRMIHPFPKGAVLPPRTAARLEDLDEDGVPEVIAAVSYSDNKDGLEIRSGEVLNLSLAGDLRWKFAFDDVLTFASGTFGGPWVVDEWLPGPAPAPVRVAVASHDYRWWPSVVTVLDSAGRRQGVFVNPGWIESLLWLSGDELAVAGFNNSRDEAAFAILDAHHIDGQAPGTEGSAFTCLACPKSIPRFYATFARSELNRVTGGRFIRARVSTPDGPILVTTVEVSRDAGDASVMYEFDRDLHLISTRYSDAYWDEHRRLELEGRLKHTRENCPERDGPAVHIWDPARGWTPVIPAGGA